MQHQPTPDCPACAAARVRLSGEFRMGCSGCCARAAARSPHCHEARRRGVQTREYRALLAQFELTHEAVQLAHAQDFEARAPA